MNTSLLDIFYSNTEHRLLKKLIEEYMLSLNSDEDDMVNKLVAKLKTDFEEKFNENTSA